MEREQIKKALECCTSADKMADCPIGCPFGDINSCEESLMYHALALITSQEQRIKELSEEVASWKEIAEGYQKQFEDCYDEKAKLTEENERLYQSCTNLERATRADTVRKMHSMLCEGRVSNDNVVIVANQVAKEMVEEV